MAGEGHGNEGTAGPAELRKPLRKEGTAFHRLVPSDQLLV